jgi:hypothetical protein
VGVVEDITDEKCDRMYERDVIRGKAENATGEARALVVLICCLCAVSDVWRV